MTWQELIIKAKATLHIFITLKAISCIYPRLPPQNNKQTNQPKTRGAAQLSTTEGWVGEEEKTAII